MMKVLRKPDRIGFIPQFTSETVVNYVTVVQAYVDEFRMDWLEQLIGLITGTFKLENQFYREIDEEDEEYIRLILDADLGDREEWELDWYDCGAFAFRLMGVFHMDRRTAAMPIFITWVNTPEGGHAVLSYLKGSLVTIIEPQNDNCFPIPYNWKLMLLCG